MNCFMDFTAQPLVSILIPTYKRAEFLRAAVQSALNQTYRNLEIIVLDDASPDHTPLLLREFADEPRLRPVRHPQNLGIVGNWQAGLALAVGKYFCFLHDDDTFEPEFVARLVEPLQADPNLVLGFCDHWVMDENGRRLDVDSKNSSRRFKRDLLAAGEVNDFPRAALVDFSLPVGATLFRRNQIAAEFLDERARGAIDAWLFYQCVKTGGAAYYVPERLMNYRAHDGGMSRSMPLHMLEGHIFRCEQILDDPQMNSIHAATRRNLAEALLNYGRGLAEDGHYESARACWRQSWALQKSGALLGWYALSYGGKGGTRLLGSARALLRR